MRSLVLVLGVVAAASGCGHSKSSDGGTTAAGTGVGAGTGTNTVTTGGTAAPVVQTGSVALIVENVSSSGAALADAPSLALTTGADTISFTPTKYVLPLSNITLSNSKGTNTIQTATASATATATGTSGLTDASASSGTSTATSTATSTGGSTGTPGANPNQTALYTCSGTTEAKCNIDLADNTAMKAAFAAPVSLPVGTYDTISYGLVCTAGLGSNGGSGFHIGVQGTVVINGTTYYTTAKADVLSATAADLGVAPATITACGGQQTSFTLPTPLEVKAGETVKVSMFLSASNIAWAGTAAGTPGLGGCVNGTTTNFVCVSLPSVVPSAGAFQPKVELYTIDVTGQGGGQVAVIADDQGNALGAYLARLYTAASGSAPIWDAGVSKFKKNADGTYDIASGTDPGAAGPRCEFPTFQRASHSGSLTASGTAAAYTATKN